MERTETALTSDLTRRKVLAGAAISAVTGLMLARSRAMAQAGTSSPMAGEETAYLFVQSGFESGVLDQATEGVQSWLLALQGAPAQTVFVSDHPERIAGAITTEQFLDLLDFAPDNPPNAALVVETESGTGVIVLELTDPVYDAAAGTMTYITKILDTDQLAKTGYGFTTEPQDTVARGRSSGLAKSSRAFELAFLGPDTFPPEFGAASLFIDASLRCSPADPSGC